MTSPRQRRAPNRSFRAKWESTCQRCAAPIAIGDPARFAPDGSLVHHRHTADGAVIYRNEAVAHRAATICPACWMAQPCDCG